MKDEKFLSVIFIEYGEKIMKTCVVEVSMDQQQNSELGNRWKDGKTKVFLKPVYAHFGGKWSSIRPNDITEYGSDNTAYVWKKGETLELFVGGGEEHTIFNLGKKHLTLNRFNSMKVGEGDDGIFYFRNTEWNIYWEIIDLD